MNEKIKQLLAWAHLEVEDIKDTNKIAEKFAELIVKECLKEINDMIVDESEQLYPNNKQTTEYVNERLMDAHDNIVDLFGIE